MTGDRKLLDHMMSRRRLLGTGAALAGAAALSTACGGIQQNQGSSGSKSKGKLKVTLFAFLGGDLAKMPKEFAQAYMDKHKNVEVSVYEQSNTIGYTKMLAQRKADPGQPLVNLGFFNSSTTVQGVGDKMWSKLDYGTMKNASDIFPSMQRKDGFGIGIGTDQYGLVYNKEKITDHPTSWKALWDPKYRGEVCLFKGPWYALVMAARLNGGGENDVAPGWALWKKNAKQLRLMVESNPQYLNVLSNGTAPLTSYFAGTSQQWIDSGAPLTYVVPDEGAIQQPVYLQAVAGSSQSQLEVAHEMIDEMISPKWCSRWAEVSVEMPANSRAKLPEKLQGLPAFSSKTREHFVDIDLDVVGRHSAAWQEQWDRDVTSRI
ncbi:MAG TPA: extracellular solute-binding protein [Streptosporangiales bacterium]